MTTFYDYKQSFCTLGTSLKINYPPQRGISAYFCDFLAKMGSLISGSFLGMKLGSSFTMEPDYVKKMVTAADQLIQRITSGSRAV